MSQAETGRPTHIFVQAGVGSLAAAVVGYLYNKFQDTPPRFIIMEPDNAACILAWEVLRDFPCCYISCTNFVAANGIRILANPLPDDAAVEAGESGSVGIGLLDLLVNNPDFGNLKKALEIGPDSTLLFFNTEGATDPENYREILWYGKYQQEDCG